MLDLQIMANLDIVIDDNIKVAVTANGGQEIDLVFPSLPAIVKIWRRHGSVLSPIVSSLDTGLRLSDLTVNVFAGSTRIARTGTGTRITLVGRIAGLPRFQLYYGNLLKALFS